MVLLDAYALIALLAGEPAADDVSTLLEARGAGITTINLAETVDVLQRVYAASASEVDYALDRILGEPVQIRALDDSGARRAGTLRARYYHRRDRPLSIADCCLLASAGADESIATADPGVVEVARLEGIEVIALPDRTGRRP